MANESAIPKELILQYDLIISRIPEIKRKGKTQPYTSINGNMYSMMRKDGALGIRLSKDDREAFLKKYQSVPFENYGAMIKEYVEVPASLLMDTEAMVYYLKRSHEYTKTLKSKSTKKKTPRKQEATEKLVV